jgi:hypothetical protein
MAKTLEEYIELEKMVYGIEKVVLKDAEDAVIYTGSPENIPLKLLRNVVISGMFQNYEAEFTI